VSRYSGMTSQTAAVFAGKLVLGCFDSITFRLNFITEIINFVLLRYWFPRSFVSTCKLGRKKKFHSTPSLSLTVGAWMSFSVIRTVT